MLVSLNNLVKDGSLLSAVETTDSNIDWVLVNPVAVLDLSENTTIAFNNVVVGKTISIVIKSSGSYTVTWPSEIKWPDGEVPEQTENGTDVYTFIAVSASEIYGAVSLNHD